MDELAAAINAVCAEAMKSLRDDLHAQKVNHRHAIDLFNNRFGGLRMLLKEQGERVGVLEKENTALKATQQGSAPHSRAGSREDTIKKELDQLRQTAFANKQSLQNQFGALQASQKQQLAIIQALTDKTTTVPSRIGKHPPAPGVDSLNVQQTLLVAQTKGIENHHGEVTRAINNQAAEIDKLRTTAVTREKGDGQEDRNEVLAGMREAITELQTAQKGQLRMMESYAADHGEIKQSQARLETLCDVLGRDVDEIRRDHGEDGSKVVLLESDITKIISRLERSEVDAGELREELLAITRTMQEVIKQMRGSAPPTGVAQEEDGGEHEPTLRLQDQLRADPTEPIEAPIEESLTRVADDYGQMSMEVAIDREDKTAYQPEFAVEQDEGTIHPPLGPVAKKRKALPSADGNCHDCGRTESSRWKQGPDGVRTLCNGCGLKYVKSLQHQKVAASTGVEPAVTAAVSATARAREASPSSTSTFGNYDQKKARLKDLEDGALKRKAALSPVTERFDGAPREITARNGFKSGISSPMKLTNTGCDPIEPSQMTAADEAPVTSEGHDADKRDDAAPGATAKRVRMNADQKAKLMADDFVADSGSDGGKKKRRFAARKTVQFDFGADFESMESGAEGEKAGGTNPGGRVDPSGIRSGTDGTITSAASDIGQAGDKRTLDSGTVKDMQSGPPKSAWPRGRVPLKGARKTTTEKASKSHQATGKPAPEPVIIPKTARNKASPGPDEQQNLDDTEDCIVVARPRIPVPQNTKPASPPTERAAELKKSVETLHDTLGSEDELALPTHVHPTYSRSAYTVASASDHTVVQSIEHDTYQSLLSQFKLREGGTRAGKGKQQETATVDLSANDGDAGAEGRPKRALKPRDFGDVVDVRTLKVKELGK